MADEAILSGARVLPVRLTAAGFPFEHPELEPALREMLGKQAMPALRTEGSRDELMLSGPAAAGAAGG
jgi:Domain of unknown function (DUF1731)